MNKETTGEFAVKVLREYSVSNALPIRSTSDLSPLEEWLIVKLKESNELMGILTDTIEQLISC
jgi:hypothetical protein